MKLEKIMYCQVKKKTFFFYNFIDTTKYLG